MKNKHLKRAYTIIIVLIGAIFLSATTANAEASRTAVCAGSNHDSAGGGSSNLTGNFTTNVDNAANWYLGFEDMYVTRIWDPMKDSLNPRIDSNIVFLNGHANPTLMDFSTAGTTLTVTSRTWSGTTSIGLGAADLSNVDLFCLVGCNTAETLSNGTENITQTAVTSGATTAIGFRDEIHSRSLYGERWLNEFNGSLYRGNSVREAINNASSSVPQSDLGTYVRVYGDSRICVNGPYMRDNKGINILGQYNPQNLDNLYSIIENNYPDVDLDGLVPTVNIYDEDTRSGFVKFTYFIDDEIETDAVVLVSVDDGCYTDVKFCNGFLKMMNLQHKRTNEIENIIDRVNRDKQSIVFASALDQEGTTNGSRYYYSFETDLLTFEESFLLTFQNNEPIYGSEIIYDTELVVREIP